MKLTNQQSKLIKRLEGVWCWSIDHILSLFIIGLLPNQPYIFYLQNWRHMQNCVYYVVDSWLKTLFNWDYTGTWPGLLYPELLKKIFYYWKKIVKKIRTFSFSLERYIKAALKEPIKMH